MLRRRTSGLLALFLIWPGGALVRAELLYFKNGGRIQAPAVVRDGVVRIESGVGDFSFLTADFLKIVPGHAPEREWPSRRDLALKRGAEVRFLAAWWALENGLVPEAVAMIRAAHVADAVHQPTARLVTLLDRLDRPCVERDVSDLSRATGVSLERATSPHVLLLHQLDPEQAAVRLDLLERVFTTFYLMLEAHGVELKIPSERLVSVALSEQSDYVRFLKSQHAGAFQTTQGYYHPTFRAVVTRQPRRDLPVRRNGEVSPDANHRDFERRRLLNDCQHRALEDGTAAHEMVHMLVNESGLSPSTDRFPLWLHEGLAAQFEVVRSGRWVGVGRAHDLRLLDWRKSEGSVDLESFLKDAGFGRGYDSLLYARSWALVYYLRKVHPEKYHIFLDVLRNPASLVEERRQESIAATFRSVFGADLGKMEKDWRRYIDGLKTPLEEESPEKTSVTRELRFLGSGN